MKILPLLFPVLAAATLSSNGAASGPGFSIRAEVAGQALAIGPVLVQKAYLKASDPGHLDRLGWSVAVSGETAVIGAPFRDGSGLDDRGAVYVYQRRYGAWVQQAYLQPPTGPFGEGSFQFGFSVAIDEDTLVVGSPWGIPWGADGTSGAAAYVFVRSEGGWNLQAYLSAANADEYPEWFGWSVAISGDTVVVGAPWEDGDGSNPADNSAEHAGAAYVFKRSSEEWSQRAYLKASNAQADDEFGSAVAVAGDVIVVGARYEDGDGSTEDNNSRVDSGAAYVFTLGENTWLQRDYIKASNADSNDGFGTNIAISGTTFVVGAIGEDGNGSSEADNSAGAAGAAYVFALDNDNWGQSAYLKASNAAAGDRFAASVAISADAVVIGAPTEAGDGSSEDDNSKESAGAAYVFARASGGWSQLAYLKASNADGKLDNFGDTGDLFGGAVAVSGGRVVVGAEGEDSDGSGEQDNSLRRSGAAYVFDSAIFTDGFESSQ